MDAIAELRSRWGVDATATLAVSEWALRYGGLLTYVRLAQRTLAKAVRTVRRDVILNGLSEDQRSWLAASSTFADDDGARSPSASDWLTTAPCKPYLRLADEGFRDLLLHRLMMPLTTSHTPCAVVFNNSTTCAAPTDALGFHYAVCAPRQRTHPPQPHP